MRNRFKETLATIRGALFLFFTLNSLFIVFGVISLGRLINNGPHELFLIGNTPVPKFLGSNTTNMGMFIFCLSGIVIISVCILRRYLYYKKDIELLRSKGIYDLNEDGKIDSFADNLFDDDH